jgi:hypothetical protein
MPNRADSRGIHDHGVSLDKQTLLLKLNYTMLYLARSVQDDLSPSGWRLSAFVRGPILFSCNLWSRRGLVSTLLLGLASWRARAQAVVYRISPSATDPQITRFNVAENWVFYNQRASASADLFLYLPGTSPTENGQPFDHFQQFFRTATDAGYNVLALQYDNHPAVAQLCPRVPDPSCAGAVREKRAFGDNVTQIIDDTPAESILNRLVKALEYLVAQHPDQNWGRYLSGQTPNWSRIAIGGHSQGAGMAAYIAKRVEVARVVLLSGPWDFSMPGRVASPWLSMPSATPPNRWYALYHVQERAADALRNAYSALRIPSDHIRALTQMPVARAGMGDRMDPFHGSVVGDNLTPKGPGGVPVYRGDWAFILGRSP